MPARNMGATMYARHGMGGAFSLPLRAPCFRSEWRMASSRAPVGMRRCAPLPSHLTHPSDRSAPAAPRSMAVWGVAGAAVSRKRQTPWHAPLTEHTPTEIRTFKQSGCSSASARPTAKLPGCSSCRWSSSTSTPANTSSTSRARSFRTPADVQLGQNHASSLESGNDHFVPRSFCIQPSTG